LRVAALYDIHGNLRALEAVLAEVAKYRPDRILVGGDVALGPMPREVLEVLAGLGNRVLYLRGNCDREMVSALRSDAAGLPAWGARTRWAAERCTSSQIELLSTLPTTQVLDIDGMGPTLFCHGSPRSDSEILTRITAGHRLRAALGDTRQRVVVSGHTHVQYDRTVSGVRWVNPGSVGMAYADVRGAYWATFGSGLTLRNTAYDVERAVADVRTSGFPDGDEFVEKYLRHCPDPAHTTAYFEGLAERSSQE